MLYKKNTAHTLSDELFKNPTSEYRGTPFWAWNTTLNKENLLKQIEYLKEMGFGGFHMHSRSGMATEYLSEEFMSLVSSCIDKAEKEEMLAWLYDEDRWPSGAAGGYVTKNIKHRQKMLVFSINEISDAVSKEEGVQSGKPYLIAKYDIVLNEDGELSKYTLFPEKCEGTLWYAYIITAKPTGWYNNQTYADTLSPETMDEFIKVTYEKYKETAGDKFDKTVPAIFTDEPQFARKNTLAFPFDTDLSRNACVPDGGLTTWDLTLPITTDFFDTFEKTYNFDIIPHLPELIWQLPENKISQARYCYHDHICERFASAFADKCGLWCEKNSLMLTGHMMEEPTLFCQTHAIGEAMRSYRSFQLPGIDMLCDRVEFSTAKQTQSAVHQYGREGMLSELYGVTGWNFDFRGHKFQGDWQAALGVTVRVPHLSWVSMRGSAKRDYPASISYQSAWFREYPYIENHYARLNTALTRGVPCVDVAVIHPIESYWLYWGPSSSTANTRDELEKNFESVINWLLFGTIDFNFIAESLLPSQCGNISSELEVGKMKYKTVIVPDCRTLRSTTVEILEKFRKSGGKVIFMSDCPAYVDALPSEGVKELYNMSEKVPFSKQSLLGALSDNRCIEIKNDNGTSTNNLIYQLREDTDCKWLFIAHGKKEPYGFENETVLRQDIIVKIKGEYTPVHYDTISGEIKNIPFTTEDGYTLVNYTMYQHDSLLLCLKKCTERSYAEKDNNLTSIKTVRFTKPMQYNLHEENVLLLDEAEYSLDGGDWHELNEILRIDSKIREKLSMVPADGNMAQPWVLPPVDPKHFVTLKYTFDSEIETPCTLALEGAEKIVLNGEEVPVVYDGYYVDFEIYKVKMPNLRKGENTLLVTMPITDRISLESIYLLGDFGVKLDGCRKTVINKPETVSFGSVTNQGFPFYGGNISYKTKIETPDCTLKITAPAYKGALISVKIDGNDAGKIVFDPYTLEIPSVKAGEHEIEFTLFGTRGNTFASLHTLSSSKWYGPTHWYPSEEDFCFEYNLSPMGIEVSPFIEILK